MSRNLLLLLAACFCALAQRDLDERDRPRVAYVSRVLDDVQHTWDRELQPMTGTAYHHAKLDLFRGKMPSGCGPAKSLTGPFYCPADEKVYLDLGFFDELRNRFGARGDFAQAYVIAHELGHHVQKILGIEAKVHQQQDRYPRERNELSVKLELQADCFAGAWAHSTKERGILREQDIESAMSAAAAVGDDHLQKMAKGYSSPESFTHGSSAQRQSWFRKGLATGRIASCNTFAGN